MVNLPPVLKIRAVENGFVAWEGSLTYDAGNLKEWAFTDSGFLADFVEVWAQETKRRENNSNAS